MSRGNITIDNLTLEVIDSEAEVLICILYTEAKHTFGDNTSFTCLSVNIGVSATTTLKINGIIIMMIIIVTCMLCTIILGQYAAIIIIVAGNNYSNSPFPFKTNSVHYL